MLLFNATLVNWTPRAVTPDQALLIRDGTIADLGLSAELRERYPDEPGYDAGGRLVLPGMICAHTHLYSAFARGIGIPGTAPADFPAVLRKLWWPLDRSLTHESVRLSALVGLVDAIKHGTTTLFDHHASPNAIIGSLDVIADAVEQAGVRAVLCYEVSDRDGQAVAEAGIAENIRFVQAVQNDQAQARANGRQLLGATFGLHANLTLSDRTLELCAEQVHQYDCGCHIHVAEHEADQEASLRFSGQRAIERLASFGLLDSHAILAHCIHVDGWEMGLLRKSGAWVTHQPRSNMNNGVGAQQFDTLRRGGVKVAIGSDGIGHDMFTEWQTASFLHKLARRDPRAASIDAIVDAGTRVNAELAESFFGQSIGRLMPGAAADVIVLDYDAYTPLTADTLLGHALFGFPGATVTGTIVAGQILMWDRALVTLDETAIAAEARAHAPEVWARYQANVPLDSE
ncbi:MAG: putative aminohydrolase SsnA [Aggregatilineales bacterium]